MLSYLVVLVIIIHVKGSPNIAPLNGTDNAFYPEVGSWSNSFIGYRVNIHRNGYLDVGDVTFNAANLKQFYMVDINCTYSYPLFVNGRIYCDSNNMLFSYYSENGSLSFWYLSLVPFSRQAITYAMSTNYPSIFMYSNPSGTLYFSSFDARTGELKGATYLNLKGTFSESPYPLGTEAGYVYFVAKEHSGINNASIYTYNIETSEIRKSNSPFPNTPSEMNPTICDNIVAIQDWKQIVAYNVDTLDQEWIYLLDSTSTTKGSYPAPVCIKNENGYRIIAYSVGLCYMLNVVNGELIAQFECDATPIFHYSGDTGFADVAIFALGNNQNNKIIVAKMDGDQVIAKQLWYGNGSISRGFIVNDYFVTTTYKGGSSISSTTLDVKIYNIYNGYIVWEKKYKKQVSSFTYSVFGGLVENENHMDIMIMIRVGNQLYAYKDYE